MEIEAIFLGILLAFIYYEIVGLTPGGIVVPGYIALFVGQPLTLAATLGVVFLTYFIVKGIRHLVILYGRRMFLASVIVGFLLKWCLEMWVLRGSGITQDLHIIGFVIPGLMANEMQKQGILQTIISLVIVSGTVYALLRLVTLVF